jgi:WD40 repeat protein
MRWAQGLLAGILGVLFLATPASAQVIGLLVGNQQSFNGIDWYAFPNGFYQGGFAGPGTPGPPAIHYFTYGPSGDLYYTLNSTTAPVIRVNGQTGNFISTFIPSNGLTFSFGPDDNLYRIEDSGSVVRRYNGTNGQLIDTFISSNLGAGQILRFGPSGDLFVSDGITASIKRFSGSTGVFLGDFTQPGAGGVGSIFDFLFAPNGAVYATSSSLPDRVFEFNGTTGAFQGYIGQGSGLSVPIGLTIGPDGNLYVASTFGNTIKSYSLANGGFLGDFVSMTAHMAPTYIQFTPTPIPEPSGIALGLIGVAALTQLRRLRARQQETTL